MPEFVSNTVQVHIASYFEEIQDWKILLLKRAENLIVYPGIWQVITGTIEKGETALQTAIREVAEETGIMTNTLQTIPYVTSFFDAKNDSINFSPVFGLTINDTQINISDEHSEFGWFTMQECKNKLVLPSHNEANQIFYDYVLKKRFDEFR